MTTRKFTCPRRAENGMDQPGSPLRGAGRLKDRYRPGHGLIGQKEGCTYCGSLAPDAFLDALKAGAELGTTGKDYKAYLAPHDLAGPNGAKFYFQHMDADQRTEFISMLNAGEVRFEERFGFTVLPYFIAARHGA